MLLTRSILRRDAGCSTLYGIVVEPVVVVVVVVDLYSASRCASNVLTRCEKISFQSRSEAVRESVEASFIPSDLHGGDLRWRR